MSRENGLDIVGAEDVEVIDVEEYEFVNFIDDAIASGTMIDKYVYEAKIGGRVVQGLTAESYSQMAIQQDICEVSFTREETEVDGLKGVLYEVTAGKKEEGKPKEEWETRTGVYFQPFTTSGRPDPFAYPKGHTKAWRNAVKKFLLATDVNAAIKTFMEIKSGKATPSQLPQAATQSLQQPQNEDAPLVKARKAMFAKYGERKADLETMGITEEILREGMYSHYGVGSRADMTEVQYKQMRAALDIDGHGKFAEWILALAP